MTAIQDEALHEEITAMLNSDKGKSVVMETLFPNTDAYQADMSADYGDICVSFQDDTCAYTNRIAVRIEWRKADFDEIACLQIFGTKEHFQSMETKIISFKEFEDLLLLM